MAGEGRMLPGWVRGKVSLVPNAGFGSVRLIPDRSQGTVWEPEAGLAVRAAHQPLELHLGRVWGRPTWIGECGGT